MEKMKRGKKR